MSWKQDGRVGELGLWAPPEDIETRLGPDNPYDFMVCPYSVTNTWSAPRFAAASRLGWQTLACSPFVRGWDFDRLAAQAREPDDAALQEKLVDAMLRFSLFGEHVDRLIVAMRRPEWGAANLASVARGPLNEQEWAWLLALVEACRQA